MSARKSKRPSNIIKFRYPPLRTEEEMDRWTAKEGRGDLYKDPQDQLILFMDYHWELVFSGECSAVRLSVRGLDGYWTTYVEGGVLPRAMLMDNTPAIIQPWQYLDEETEDRIGVSVSSCYSKITVNRREYFFIVETGEFDGTATCIGDHGPTLVYHEGGAPPA